MHSSLVIADYLLNKKSYPNGVQAPQQLLKLVDADYLLDSKGDDGTRVPLPPQKLLKLVYIAHGWMLGLHDRPLMVDPVEAWKYGPIVSGLYHAVRHFKSNPVEYPLSRDKGVFDDAEKSVMDQVFDIYGKYSGIELSRMTHAPETPWSEMRKFGIEIIRNDLIKSHFQKIVSDSVDSKRDLSY